MSSSLSLLLLLCAVCTSQAALEVSRLRASKLLSHFATPDAYVMVSLGVAEGQNADLGKTATQFNTRNPWWKEDFHHLEALEGDVLEMKVYEKDPIFDDLLGLCQNPIQVGVWNVECSLITGGTLYYSYTLTK